jgi:hypothetical protein
VRNPRRAYKADGSVIAPMDLANMRANGVRAVEARCEACGHEAVVNCDALPVPDVALRLRCSPCGSKKIVMKPNWTERPRIA